jgi:hypothetical protein
MNYDHDFLSVLNYAGRVALALQDSHAMLGADSMRLVLRHGNRVTLCMDRDISPEAAARSIAAHHIDRVAYDRLDLDGGWA